METQSQVSPRCLRCSVPLRDHDLVMREHGEWCHVRCLPPSTSSVRAEPAAVLCGICLQGIASIADLDITAKTPAHIHCRLGSAP
jgi:hypothetical protein